MNQPRPKYLQPLPGLPSPDLPPDKPRHLVYVQPIQVQAVLAVCPCGRKTRLINDGAHREIASGSPDVWIDCGGCGAKLNLRRKLILGPNGT